MKRLLIALFLCLFAFKASAWNPMVVCPGSAGCTASTPGNDFDELGNIDVEAADATFSLSRMYCYLYVPDCSGDLGTAYLYGRTLAGTRYGKVSVYSTTNTDESLVPTNGSLAGGTAAISFVTGVAWQSQAMSGGSVVTTSSYWVCLHTDAVSGPNFYYGAGGTRHYVGITDGYTIIPPTLPVAANCIASTNPYSCCTGEGTGCSWTTASDSQASIFVGIE